MKGIFALVPTSRTSAAALVASLGLAASVAWADPVPESSPPTLVPGFQFDWVNVSTSPHSIDDAINALAGSGGFVILHSVSETRSTVELNDGNAPFGGSDPLMAVRVTGFVQLVAGTYQFAAVHDDGVRLTIGGQNVIEFATDTSPTLTLSSTYALQAGVYSFQAIGWEQGGQFLLNIGTWNSGASAIDPLSGLHVTAVPEPGAWASSTAGLLFLGGMRQLRRKSLARRQRSTMASQSSNPS